MPAVTTDPSLSASFCNALDVRLRGRVLDDIGQFCCSSGPSCRASVGAHGFAAGQLSYVGDHYAVTVNEQPTRILIVSMQVGDDEAPVSMSRRREQIRTRIPESFGQRNQHMAGVTTALRVLFGGAPGADRAGELLHTAAGDIHVLDAYAMVNSVLCSRRPGEGREGAPSRRMIENCSRHLRTTVEILEPTIIHSQGRSVGLSTHQAIGRICDTVDRVDDEVAYVTIGRVNAVWCSLKHPARNWGQLGRQYLHDVAAPALRRSRLLAGMP